MSGIREQRKRIGTPAAVCVDQYGHPIQRNACCKGAVMACGMIIRVAAGIHGVSWRENALL